MSIFASKLLLIILSIVPAKYDVLYELPEERRSRMETISLAIEDAANHATCSEEYKIPECKRIWGGSKELLALYILSLAKSESELSRKIHENNCKYECDWYYSRSGELKHRAISPWQLHKSRFVPDWEDLGSIEYEPTRKAAWHATVLYCGYYGMGKSAMAAYNLYKARAANSNTKDIRDMVRWAEMNAGRLFLTKEEREKDEGC